MRIPDLIQKKRDNKELEDEEIRFFIRELVEGRLEDAQLGAMLMALYLNDMNSRERAILTESMTHSGDTLRWPNEWKDILVDKHSTGGVGDKISLVLAPALAACGLKVPMISGRGLGFTGGTLDKLESIPGFKVNLSNEEMQNCLSDCGCCIAGQTPSLVPADRLMYATRDITATVDNVGLITASIISKKAAENISALVLDVKVGRASFMKTIDSARQLAHSLVDAAKKQGIKTTAVLTAMDTPIGMMIGNSLEIIETVRTLSGNGPRDLVELVVVQGALLLHSVGRVESLLQGERMISQTLANGTALETFEKMLINQGVQAHTARNLCSDANKVLPTALFITPITATSSGVITDIDALTLANVCCGLGAGRCRAADTILAAVGIELLMHVGDKITEHQQWARLHHEASVTSEILDKIASAITIAESIDREQGSMSRILEMIF